MSKLIALAGKGGTGKTTIASAIIRMLLYEASSLLAIDADPNNNLYEHLGLKKPETIMDMVEDISKGKISIPGGMTKDRFINMKIQEVVMEADKFDLLSMGRPEGPGCYCYANNLLRDLIEKMEKNYNTIVIDNEAGMEHLSRRLTKKIDYLFIVSDFSIIGIRSAKSISDLVGALDLKVGESFLILNKAAGDIKDLEDEINRTKIKFAGSMPYDKNLEALSVRGGSIFELEKDSPVLKSIDKIMQIFVFTESIHKNK